MKKMVLLMLLPTMLAALMLLAGCVRQAQSEEAPAKAPGLYELSPEAFFQRPEVQRRFTKDSIDMDLLETAIFQQTNLARAKEKLAPLAYSEKLERAARQHSEEMAKLQYFSHESPVDKNRTMQDRITQAGLKPHRASENIAVLPTLEMGSGTIEILTGPDGKERRIDAKTHKPLDYYTHAEFAQKVVDDWLHSPGHRANLLDKNVHFLGVGAGRGLYNKTQDSVYITQNFASDVEAAKP